MRTQSTHYRHRGAVIVNVSIAMTVMIGMAALAVDIGVQTTALTELQVSADAAALAGAHKLLDERRLLEGYDLEELLATTRDVTAEVAALNRVFGDGPILDLNSENAPDGDIVLGYLGDPADRVSPLDLSAPPQFNCVQVLLQRNEGHGGSIARGFANIFCVGPANLEVGAAAMFQDGVVGYKLVNAEDRAHLLPFALREQCWIDLLAEGATVQNDNYTYDSDTGEVYSGPDGLPEINLYPGAGAGQLPPGNFGTVDIGSPNNSTKDIARQILEGVNEDDLSYFGGELKLGPDGTLELNGDTGLSAGVKDELAAIKGQPRSIPIFSAVEGPGNNAQYTVVGFVGVRIVNVKLTGPMSKKNVIIQPAVAVDNSAIAEIGGNSYFVYRPVTLCR